MKIKVSSFLSCSLMVVCLLKSNMVSAQAVPEFKVPFKQIGKIKTLNASEIKSSMWSIGGETLDRDNTDYNSYKKYLGPLGAKRIRLQGGWAKTEKVKGVYDFAWLDAVVNDAVSQGVTPWLELSYGNKIYEGGGNTTINSPLPTGEALIAWTKWVNAMVSRYKNRVTEWEVWNEVSGHGDALPAEQYAAFYITTAETVRSIQPKGKMVALALAGLANTAYPAKFLDYLAKEKKLGLVDIITYHDYPPRPEAMSAQVLKLRQIVDNYDKGIVLWQGETGCPSTDNTSGALRQFAWSEFSQAKYIMRRMMDDIAHHVVVSNIFQISDMVGYNGKTNSKGLLKANPDRTIAYAKPSYGAMQHMATAFNNMDINSNSITTNMPDSLSVLGYTNKNNKKQMLSIYLDKRRPDDEYKTASANITIAGGKFEKPVFVNLLNGNIYQIPKEQWSQSADGVKFTDIPVTDYPVLIVESSLFIN
jgi:hypothetical protein